ncbi:MAG: cytochrome d ubiquinol oxidase subunit II [Pseudonocardia sp.]|uniref:cytochrome d ubiquinol oxidase subunit II n=1 Tax=unclassified Pseudonocardia TaxID=2619320 RepID=UPI000869F0A1|nr:MULTISPECIES: cytochrome d ubiquinol oxidase subunit II [unclassified Pseudonocardia]MBN9110806.1 cytochrome d ubiquinol oxidase subunit II [Pseudonocardia sp.]ODU26885.1 MAG: cytochrome d ubiquinol oxidase subunit II [Pseudonocardia sp. SCN 72-51]ODV05392.1 MAG: cytochrome d ubiquinol oxidase subunit II [Pseudonocardia sp. SCN 73-27]
MELTTVWFLLIAVLWTGYFVLEGFDFGVGMLLPLVSRDETDRRVALGTIGPVWDGNEVWVLVAGGATFAAFPEWYASMFSGFYLALLVLLVALILRGMALEYRGKIDDARWRRRWDVAIVGGSLVPALLWGVAFGNIVRGVPLDSDHVYVGTFWTLLNPFALLGGLTTVLLFVLHGAVFLALKTSGDVRSRATSVARIAGPLVVVAGGGFLAWAVLAFGPLWTLAPAGVAAAALVAAVVLAVRGREGWAFVATTAAVVAVVVTLFGTLFPDVLPATDPANSLTTTNAASTHYTLTIMTWVAGVVTPVVLAYQAWTFWVFRKRLTRSDVGDDAGLRLQTTSDASEHTGAAAR